MTDEQNASTIAAVIAAYLEDRDDIASAVLLRPTEGPSVIDVRTQTGDPFTVVVT